MKFKAIIILSTFIILSGCNENVRSDSEMSSQIDSTRIYISKTQSAGYSISDSLAQILNGVKDKRTFEEFDEDLFVELLALENSLTIDFLEWFIPIAEDSIRVKLTRKALALSESIFGIYHKRTVLLTKHLGKYFLKDSQDYIFADSLLNLSFARYPFTKMDSIEWLDILFHLCATKRQLSEYDFADTGLQQCHNYARSRKDTFYLTRTLTERSIIAGTQNLYQQAFDMVDTAMILASHSYDTSQIKKSQLIIGALASRTLYYAKADAAYKIGQKFVKSKSESIELQFRRIENFLRWEKVDTAQEVYSTIDHLDPSKFGKFKYAFLKHIEATLLKDLGRLDHAIQSIDVALQESDPIFSNLSGELLPNIISPQVNEWSMNFLGVKAQIIFEKYKEAKDTTFLEFMISIYNYIDDVVLNAFQFGEEGDELHAIDLLHQVYFEGAKIFLELYQSRKEEKYLIKVHEFSERMRSRLLFRDIEMNRIAKTANPKASDLLSKIDKLTSQLSSQINKKALNEYDNQQEIRIQLNQELENCCPDIYFSIYQKPTPKIQEVKHWASRDSSTILSTFLGYDGDLILTYYSEDTIIAKYISKSKKMLFRLNQFATDVFQGGDNKDDSLYNSMFEDLAIADHCKLIILADAELDNIPFQLIPFEKQPLGEHIPIFYTYTLSRLLIRKPHTPILPKNLKVLSLVNADRGDVDLPYSYKEGQLIKQKFGRNAKVFYGKDATFKNLNQFQKAHNVLHFALHGNRLISNRNLFGIVFKDGIQDLGNLQFNKDLVIVNTCYSNSGNHHFGEGTHNLLRTMSLSGASTVIGNYEQEDDLRAYGSLKEYLEKGNSLNLKVVLN